MARQASVISSSFTCYQWKYDVFLSFRGIDTRRGFTSYLFKALKDKGIHTFLDDEELRRGEQITPSLVKAIEESRIVIPVFSENYASSSFCLDELVVILASIKEEGRMVLPVFYDVDPSDVRHQRGSYMKALSNHEERFKDNKEKVNKWREALRQVADLSGYHFQNHGNENEYEFIGKIVKEISNKINRAPLHVADYPVGLESRVLKVKSLLNFRSDGVHMVGIHGIGGIGKTTVARAVYNSIADHFEGLCFLDNVRENSIKYGLVHLQQTLLSEIVGVKDINLGSVSKGIPIIKHRIHQKKVLLVLDDVDRLEQLRAIVGGPDWFGPGSRVIITTRDKHLLTSHLVEKTYEVDGLNKKEALELISWNAFKTNKVDPSYLDILNRAVTYASGLPLALEVIGSHLFGRRMEEWESALYQYERIPNKDIQNILKVSFDSLEEDQQKFFLDITCYFKGYALPYVKKILCAHHGFCPEFGIGVLIDKSLIKNVDGCVTLHDLIEDMGKEIVRQESPEEPGKRSRLWFPDDIVHVLEENTGTCSIQIIILKSCQVEVVEWDGKAFEDMKNLKTLIIKKGCFSKGPEFLPNSLRVLEWWRYPSPSLPSNFHPKKLVILELPEGCLKSVEFLMSNKKFVNMSVLNLDHSQYITEIPDMSSVPNLEELSFKKCVNLIKIDKSVGLLSNLKILNANSCSKLRSFPPINLTSLERLKLSYCGSLESFPEILGNMVKLTTLDIMHTPIKKIPFSIQKLTQLEKLALRSCGIVQLPSSIFMIRELRELIVGACKGLQISEEDQGEAQVSSMVFDNTIDIRLWQCNISDEFFQIGLLLFANVKSLNLYQVNLTILPACIKECRCLTEIYLVGCEKLQEIRGIPPMIEKFSITPLKDWDFTLHTRSLECYLLKENYLEGCHNLQEIRGIPPYNIVKFSARKCSSLKYLDFTLLPAACTTDCCSLKEIKLISCQNLREIVGIPPNIRTFTAIKCTSLEELDLRLVQESHFFKILILKNCKNLREIRGIPPSIRILSVMDCPSLSSECRSMLLNEELHRKGGKKLFHLPGSRIPDWFEHHTNGSTISFWFRNKVPRAISMCLCVTIRAPKYEGNKWSTISEYERIMCPTFIINGITDSLEEDEFHLDGPVADYIFIRDIKRLRLKSRKVLLGGNQWNHVQCTISGHSNRFFVKQIGLHVFKHRSSKEDIRFTDPSSALNDDMSWHSDTMASTTTPSSQDSIWSRNRKKCMFELYMDDEASEEVSSTDSDDASEGVEEISSSNSDDSREGVEEISSSDSDDGSEEVRSLDSDDSSEGGKQIHFAPSLQSRWLP